MKSSAVPAHYIIGSGDDMAKFVDMMVDIKPDIAGFYTPKLFEMLATKTFKETKDMSFLSVIAAAGSQLSPSMYERLENQLRPKVKNMPLILK